MTGVLWSVSRKIRIPKVGSVMIVPAGPTAGRAGSDRVLLSVVATVYEVNGELPQVGGGGGGATPVPVRETV